MNVDDNILWHRRLGHVGMSTIEKLLKLDLVVGMPKLNLKLDSVCEACQLGKQTRKSFKNKNFISTSMLLELLHLHLCGPSRTTSLGGKSYAFVIVDDFSRYTWTLFLAHKNDAFDHFKVFVKKVENEKNLFIKQIRSDHGTEFQNENFSNFCQDKGIGHNFSCPRTPQQNGVVERKNKTLVEIARTMLCEHSLPKYFWAEAMNSACYIINRVSIRPILKKTPYELWRGRKLNISYFRTFGTKCFIHNNGKDNLGKFDAKSDKGIFLGYSTTSRAYRVFNKRTLVVEESMHVIFDESNPCVPSTPNIDDDDLEILGEKMESTSLIDKGKDKEDTPLPKEWTTHKDHPIDLIIGSPSKGVSTHSSNMCNYLLFFRKLNLNV